MCCMPGLMLSMIMHAYGRTAPARRRVLDWQACVESASTAYGIVAEPGALVKSKQQMRNRPMPAQPLQVGAHRGQPPSRGGRA